MVQEQLTDYISSQMKLGVSRDAIKSALVSAGWVAGDVEDTLKKMEGSAAAPAVTAASQPAAAINAAKSGSSMMSPTTSAAASSASKGSGSGSSGPQMIRVGDLVSSPFSGSSAKPTASAASSTAASATAATAATAATSAAKFGGTIKGNSFEAAPAGGKVSKSSGSSGKGMLIMEIVGVILILGLGALAWYFYSGNAGLAAKVTSLTTESASVTSQLSALQSQINASSTADAAQIASLTAENTDLALDLSFYAVPLNTPTSTATAPMPATISGSVSGGGKAPYALTTSLGAKIFVANSSDATIGPELKAAVGQTVQLSGTYIQGSDEITVSSVATTTAQ